jgi:hypothetical protein
MQAGKVRWFVAVYWVDFSVRESELRPVVPLPVQQSARASASFQGTESVKDKRKKSTGRRTAIAWQGGFAENTN